MVNDFDGPPAQTNELFILKITEHSCDHFPGSSKMVGNLLMGDFYNITFLDIAFFHEKGCQPFIETLPEYLLHEPHDFRESTGNHLIDEIRDWQRFIHELFKYIRRDAPQFTVFFCFDSDIKLQIAKHAGGGKHAGVPVEQAIYSNFPAFLREDVGPQLT